MCLEEFSRSITWVRQSTGLDARFLGSCFCKSKKYQWIRQEMKFPKCTVELNMPTALVLCITFHSSQFNWDKERNYQEQGSNCNTQVCPKISQKLGDREAVPSCPGESSCFQPLGKEMKFGWRESSLYFLIPEIIIYYWVHSRKI